MLAAIRPLARLSLASLALMAMCVLAAPVLAQDATAETPADSASTEATEATEAAKAKPAEKSFEEQKKEDGLWVKRGNWIGVRAGYAKRGGGNSGDGLFGYGISYQRMLTRVYSLNAAVQHDVIGHLGNALEYDIPMTLEFQRHFGRSLSLRPFIGLGAGYHWRKFYRTAGDYGGAPVSGWHVSIGANAPLDDKHVLGFETRVAVVPGRGTVNPVFGSDSDQSMLWSAKLTWALGY